jgi:hypothetical protein
MEACGLKIQHFITERSVVSERTLANKGMKKKASKTKTKSKNAAPPSPPSLDDNVSDNNDNQSDNEDGSAFDGRVVEV